MPVYLSAYNLIEGGLKSKVVQEMTLLEKYRRQATVQTS